MSAHAGAPAPTVAVERLFAVDLLKALGCLLIVAHHLAFYGPMSDVVHLHVPALTGWLYDHARLAVQLFLVLGGFLAAAQLMPTLGGAAPLQQPLALVGRRYRRLVVPLLAALVFAVAVAALLRPWFEHESVPALPALGQLLAHALLLQDLLGLDALSAGVWYVAIDFQLYALAVGLVWLASRTARPGRTVVALAALGAALSLGLWNRREALDVTALYFFGAYGLGMLAYWGSRSAPRGPWLLGLLALGGAALVWDWRARIAVALMTALALLLTGGVLSTGTGSRASRAVQALARISYSVFLIHFSVCLAVNAAVSSLWPSDPWANALGMAAAFGLSLLAGWGLHQWVERRRPTPRAVLSYQAVLLLSGAAVLTLDAAL